MTLRYICSILLFTVTLLQAGEQRLLLTGISVHEKSHNQFGDRFNAWNAGIGYEKNTFEDYGKWYFTVNTMLFNDSFKNPQLTVGFGHAMRFDYETADVALGLAGFVGWKKLYDADDTTGHSGKYGLMGGVAPMVAVYHGKWSLNFVYVPSAKIKDRDITGFAFGYFGWKF
jgi:hypothetical protein